MPNSELANRKGNFALPTEVRADFACHEYIMRLLNISPAMVELHGADGISSTEVQGAWDTVISNWSLEQFGEDRKTFSQTVRALWDLHYARVYTEKYAR